MIEKIDLRIRDARSTYETAAGLQILRAEYYSATSRPADDHSAMQLAYTLSRPVTACPARRAACLASSTPSSGDLCPSIVSHTYECGATSRNSCQRSIRIRVPSDS